MARRPSQTIAVDPEKDARRRLADLTERDRRHRQICSECHTAGSDTMKLCDDGWERAKQLARAAATVRRYDDARPPQPVQVTLW